jgi:hypothetical protein
MAAGADAPAFSVLSYHAFSVKTMMRSGQALNATAVVVDRGRSRRSPLRGKLAIMTHANRAEFENAAFEVNLGRAIGLQAGGTFSGGMVSATVAEVPVGSSLCRITHSALPAEVSLTSPWWAYKADFALILSKALSTTADFRDVLRDSLALASDYTIPNDRADMIRAKYGRDALITLKNFSGVRPYDRIFEIETLSPLLAFTGIGRDVVDAHPDSAFGTLKTWLAATDIRQLFIPGLQDTDRHLSAVGRASMHYRRSLNLSHWIDRQIDAVDGTAAAPTPT